MGLTVYRKYQNSIENRAQSLYFYHSIRYATITECKKNFAKLFMSGSHCHALSWKMKTLSCQFYLNVRINLALSCYMSYLFMSFVARKEEKKSIAEKKIYSVNYITEKVNVFNLFLFIYIFQFLKIQKQN